MAGNGAIRKGLLALALLAGGCSASDGPERVVEPRAFEGNAPRGTALMRKAMLVGHNAARAAVGEAPLAWDAGIAMDAQRYADTLARTDAFKHSELASRGASPEGENLFTGTRGAYRYSEMVGLWVAEKRYFKNGVTPDFSTSGDWHDVAHYAQIIWRDSERVGCGFAASGAKDYLVCRYSPPGNVVGRRVF